MAKKNMGIGDLLSNPELLKALNSLADKFSPSEKQQLINAFLKNVSTDDLLSGNFTKALQDFSRGIGSKQKQAMAGKFKGKDGDTLGKALKQANLKSSKQEDLELLIKAIKSKMK